MAAEPPADIATGADPGEDAELAALLDTLDEATEIATRTRMNGDWVPGVVNVLHGEELEALGVATVWEALSLVPGLQTTRNSIGEPLVLVRGAGHDLHSGNLKVLLNEIPMNNDLNGHAFPVLTLPVEQVERIDVLLGPGSALYGEFAFQGVVSVITRKADRRAYLRADENETYGGGVMANWEDEGRGIRLWLNAGGWDSEGAGVDSGPDAYFDRGIGFSPGPVDDREGSRFALLGLEYRGYKLSGTYVRRTMGEFFGVRSLPPPGGLEEGNLEDWSLSLQKHWNLLPDLDLSGRLLWQKHDELAPVNMLSPPGAPLLPEGGFQQRFGSTRKYAGEAILSWAGWPGHKWLLGLAYSNVEVTDSWREINVDTSRVPPVALGGIQRFEGENAFAPIGTDRELLSLTLQDQWQVTRDLEITGGLRYDNYSDIGDSLTPRIAAVWRPGDTNVFKAQYAEAFRPPTLSEIYERDADGRDMKPETLSSTELTYLYRVPSTRVRATLFYTRLENIIAFGQAPRDAPFSNRGGARQKGAEAEWTQQLDRDWRLSANLSYTDAREDETDQELAGSARWLGNLVLEGAITPRWLLALRWSFVGDRPRLGDGPPGGIIPGDDPPGAGGPPGGVPPAPAPPGSRPPGSRPPGAGPPRNAPPGAGPSRGAPPRAGPPSGAPGNSPRATASNVPSSAGSDNDRGRLDGYSIVDLTLSRSDLGIPGLTARIGVHNLFDSDVRAIASNGTYVEDLPQPGRTFWAQVRYQFR